jgi:3-dehydroquinate synthase
VTAARWALAGLLLLAFILVPWLLFDEAITRMVGEVFASPAAHGPLIALLIVALLALDVVLPTPSSLVSVAAGALFGWLLGGILIWLGMTLGCLLGYWLGAQAGRPLARRLLGEAELARAMRLSGRVDGPALALTRAVPVLAEATTLAAGAAGAPLSRFVIVTSLANAGVAAVYAGVGAAALSQGSFLLAFAAAAGLPAVGWLLARLVSRRTSVAA